MRLRPLLLLPAFYLLLGAAPATPPKAIPLFNGADLSNWTWEGPAETRISDAFTVKDGILHCANKPIGTIFTRDSYENFLLTVEYRHVTKGNGGVFICVAGDLKVLPDGVQVQLKSGSVGDLINQNKGMKAMTVDKERTTDTKKDLVTKKLKEGVEKPIGEWNTLVVSMDKGTLKVTLNGTLLNEATGLSPTVGKVGLQSEGAEMEYRKMELAPVP